MRRAISGILIGILGTLAIQYSVRYVAGRRHQESKEILKWAYLHVPHVVGVLPGSGRTLDVTITALVQTPKEVTGRETLFRVRLVYEKEGEIKVIRAVCKFVNGRLVSPSDSELRTLDAASSSLKSSI